LAASFVSWRREEPSEEITKMSSWTPRELKATHFPSGDGPISRTRREPLRIETGFPATRSETGSKETLRTVEVSSKEA